MSGATGNLARWNAGEARTIDDGAPSLPVSPQGSSRSIAASGIRSHVGLFRAS